MERSLTAKRHFEEVGEPEEYAMEDGDVLTSPAAFGADGRAACSAPFWPAASAAAPFAPANAPLAPRGSFPPPPAPEHGLGPRNEHLLAAPPAAARTDLVWSSQGAASFRRNSKRKRLSAEQLGRDMAVMSLEDGTDRAAALCSSPSLARSVPGGITLGYLGLQHVDRPPAAKLFGCFANPPDVPMNQDDDGDTSDEEAAAEGAAGTFRLSFKPRIPDHVLRPFKVPETGALVLYQPPAWRATDFVVGDGGSLNARVEYARKQQRETGCGDRDSKDYCPMRS